MSQDGTERTLPLSEAGHIDSLREAFAGAWKSGANPRLEDFLREVHADSRHVAFRELFKIEVKLRRRRQEKVTVEEYVGRFPAFESAIHEVLAASGDSSGRAPGAGSGLHVRCPNCGLPIELAPDAELESIRCGVCGSDFSLTSNADEATRDARGFARIGHFKLVERIGMGAFGTVWKAQDLTLDRTVALKIPRAGQLTKQQEEFFLREARSAAQLRHPNIVPVHEVGRDDETLYIVSDFVRGVDLAEWLTASPPSSLEATRICAAIADALHHAHERGVVHRDLKPANVMIDAIGHPHLMDFGLARRDVGESTMTLDGQIIGTPAYMSPEQATGEAHTADRRSDVYSLGVILFQLLTGELPFRGSARMMMHQVIHDPPPSPRKFDASVHKDLETITLRCLEKAPKRRYQTAGELSDELRRFLVGVPIEARPVSATERFIRWAKRKPALATAGALVVILALAGPLTAITIYNQSLEVSRKNAALSHEIVRSGREKDHDAAIIDQLAKELDVWEGKSNPWSFWPPTAVDEPRRMLLRSLSEDKLASLGGQLRAGKFSAREAAYGYIALAQLAAETGQENVAVRHWKAAISTLEELSKSGPDGNAYAQAGADCYVQLARLQQDERQAALQDLDRAVAIYKSLAGDLRNRAALVDAEFRRAMLTRYDEALDQLSDVDAMQRELTRNWPNDPIELYRLVSFLIQRPASLIPLPLAGEPAAASVGALKTGTDVRGPSSAARSGQ